MEYRKLISFGKSSFVISLPKCWINQNKLKKGDLLYLEESGPNLVLAKKDNTDSKIDSSMVIMVDGKSNWGIERELCTAYILNNHEIILKGKQLKNKIKSLQDAIQNLIALELMEQTSETIIARDFLNMDQVSLTELVKKMDVVTRTMLNETTQVLEENNYEGINDRDKDINRLYLLLYRALLYNLDNPTKAMKNLKLTSRELLKIYFVGFYIEMIADEVRRTVRHAMAMKQNPEKQKEVLTFLDRIGAYYLDTIKCFYKQDLAEVLKLSDKKMEFDSEIETLEKDVRKIEYLNRAINNLRRLLVGIHNLGRVIYTLS